MAIADTRRERHDSASPEPWKRELAAFALRDRRSPPPPDPIVFTGSSSIRRWRTLARDLAPLPVVNRGFGGSQMEAVLRLAPRIVLPYRPRAVVLYTGENDLEAHTEKVPGGVLAEIRAFAALLDRSRPASRLYLISVKPSPARHGRWPQARRLNSLLEAFAGEDRRRTYLDVATPMLARHGRRRRELFLDDGLHLSRAGYMVWTAVVRPRLLADLGAR